MGKTKGMVFNIQRYTLDDGPGIRSTVFLKGCPLRCLWCSNPESQNLWPEITHRDTSCKKCLRCVEVCEEKAIAVDEKSVYIDRKLCTRCGKCVDACPSKTLQFMGQEMSVNEVLKVVKKDMQYYQNSGGGVTVSGGEVLFQPLFAEALFKKCHEAGIHTCLDTTGYGDTDALKRILSYVDLVYYDVKFIDPIAHKKYIGQSNELILHNLEVVVESGTPVLVRVPVITGINDTDAEIRAIAEKAAGLKKIQNVHLLPYHRYGLGKYKILDRPYEMGDVDRPTKESLERIKGIFASYGLVCDIRE